MGTKTFRYTGDTFCNGCNEFLSNGEIIAKIDHNYVNGKCVDCNLIDGTNEKKQQMTILIGAAVGVVCIIVLISVLVAVKKKKKSRK